MPKERPNWRLADLIDYEFFLDADEQGGAGLHGRDRELYLKEIAPVAGAEVVRGRAVSTAERRSLLRHWTEGRRRMEQGKRQEPDEAPLPGEAYDTTQWWVAGVSGGFCAIAGASLASWALAYRAGEEPINAFSFFVEFALTQTLVLIGAFAVINARWWFPDWKIPSLARYLMSCGARKVAAGWMRGRELVSGTTRQKVEALYGVLRARHALYRGVIIWRLVALMQVLVVCFNLGVLGAMSARHLFHDLDFGWESTWLEASEVSDATRAIAAPWSWLVKPGYPDAAQVAGSQNRKRDSTHLDTASLKSWSQFLFGCVIVYALIPRALLLGLAMRAQRSRINALAFNDARSVLTLSRLLTPTMETHGAGPAGAGELPEPALGRGSGAAADGVLPFAPAAAALPAEFIVVNLTEFSFAAAKVGAVLEQPMTDAGIIFTPDPSDPAEEARTYANIGRTATKRPDAEIVGLVASWVPPMRATRESLDQFRKAVGPERLIKLALLGKPRPDGGFEPVQSADRELWVKAVRIRADPFLALP